uniref:Uncharacterized protein n=1 Tax=Romanomermis culicivorax TaxID=13658 RepID=A0A915JHZ2_ROMCU
MAYKRKNNEQVTELATKFAKVDENLMATESMRSLNETMEKRMEIVENRVEHLERVGRKRIAWLYNFPFDLYPMDVKAKQDDKKEQLRKFFNLAMKIHEDTVKNFGFEWISALPQKEVQKLHCHHKINRIKVIGPGNGQAKNAYPDSSLLPLLPLLGLANARLLSMDFEQISIYCAGFSSKIWEIQGSAYQSIKTLVGYRIVFDVAKSQLVFEPYLTTPNLKQVTMREIFRRSV